MLLPSYTTTEKSDCQGWGESQPWLPSCQACFASGVYLAWQLRHCHPELIVCCCGADDPWLILHKLDSPSKMRYIGSRFGACRNATSATVIPGSIAEWVSQTGRQ